MTQQNFFCARATLGIFASMAKCSPDRLRGPLDRYVRASITANCSSAPRWRNRHNMLRNILNWLDHRTGVESAVNYFLYEDIPASAGWHQVLGSVAMFAFLMQVVTGILLAFNYAPTPGDAYHSLRYIVTQLTAGSLIRGLHHWGASLMIIVVVSAHGAGVSVGGV